MNKFHKNANLFVSVWIETQNHSENSFFVFIISIHSGI